MSDSLTNYLVGRIKSTTPCVIKYVPYGALVEVRVGLDFTPTHVRRAASKLSGS